MKNIKLKKAFIFCFLCVFLISIFAVNCFAADSIPYLEQGDVLVFNDVLDFPISTENSLLIDFYVLDPDGNKINFNAIGMSYRGYPVLTYITTNPNTHLEVYIYGWIDSCYQTIYVETFTTVPSDWNIILSINTHDQVSNYYSQIYDLIMDSVYGNVVITSDMTLSASIIATVLSILVILAPLLVCAFIFVFILKRV